MLTTLFRIPCSRRGKQETKGARSLLNIRGLEVSFSKFFEISLELHMIVGYRLQCANFLDTSFVLFKTGIIVPTWLCFLWSEQVLGESPLQDKKVMESAGPLRVGTSSLIFAPVVSFCMR